MMSQNISPDRPGIVKRVEALENVREHMMEFVTPTQYLHALRHAVGGDDPISAESIGAALKAHSHSWGDINDFQDMINNLVKFDLNKLVEALIPLLKPHISSTARKVGGYGNWSNGYAYDRNPCRLEGLTPGKLLFIRGLANQNDAFRPPVAVAAYASYFPSVSGVWGGMGNKYPGLNYGRGGNKEITKDPVNNKSSQLIAEFDRAVANPSEYRIGDTDAYTLQIRSNSDGMNEGFFLIHNSTVRVGCAALSGDNYPHIEFWEY